MQALQKLYLGQPLAKAQILRSQRPSQSRTSRPERLGSSVEQIVGVRTIVLDRSHSGRNNRIGRLTLGECSRLGLAPAELQKMLVRGRGFFALSVVTISHFLVMGRCQRLLLAHGIEQTSLSPL